MSFEQNIINKQAEMITELRERLAYVEKKLTQQEEDAAHWRRLKSVADKNPTVKDAWENFLFVLSLS